MSKNNNFSLIKKYQSGSKDEQEEVFAELVDRYYKNIERYIYMCIYDEKTSEDLAQESFCRIWKSLNTFEYKSQAEFVSWLFRIARNVVIDYIREKKRKVIIHTNEKGINEFPDLFIKADTEFLDAALHLIQQELGEKAKKVLQGYVDDKRYFEIAEELNISESTVRRLIRKILGVLRNKYNEG